MQLSLRRRRQPTIRVTPRRQRDLVAASRPVDEKTATDLPKLRQAWQAEVLGYYDQLGCCRYPAQLSGQLLSRVRLFVGARDPAGEVVESEDEKELSLLDALSDQDGGHRTLLQTYGEHRFLTGESELVNTLDPDDDQVERWELLSPLEWRAQSDGRGFIRATFPGGKSDYRDASQKPLNVGLLKDEARVWRLWRKHPAYSGLADSPAHSVLGLYEEMSYLSLAARSRILSRLAQSGIFFYNGAISFPNLSPQNSDEDPESDPFFAEAIAHVTAAIKDPGSASAIVPLLARVDDTSGRPLSELFYHWQPIDGVKAYPETARQEAILSQIATGIDFPPETLLGISNMNHWGAWLADQQTWQTHGEPEMIAFCSDFTAAYLRPLAASLNLSRAEDLVIGFDAAAAVTDPDRTKTALELYRERTIGKAALREAGDFDDDDAPTPDELNEMIGVAVRDASVAIYGIPSLKTGGIEPAPGTVEKGPSGGGTTTETPAPTGSEPASGPPTSAPANVQASANGHLRAAVRGAGMVALLRARELAGSRIRSRKDSCPECFQGYDAVSNESIAMLLGVGVLEKIGAPGALSLVDGCARSFVIAVRHLGVDSDMAEALAREITSHAAATLFDDKPEIPDEFGDDL